MITLNKKIIKRVLEISEYILNTKDTIRKTASIFGISKSTVHKDIQERLKEIDIEKYQQIQDIFENHIKIRHILGGQSTKIKYLELKQSKG